MVQAYSKQMNPRNKTKKNWNQPAYLVATLENQQQLMENANIYFPYLITVHNAVWQLHQHVKLLINML